MDSFECYCGKKFAHIESLTIHMSASGCMQFATSNTAPLPPSFAAAREAAAQQSVKIKEQGKRARARTFAEARRKDIVLELAMQRYIKCIKGNAVDYFKSMHIRANEASRRHAMSELQENIMGRTVDESLMQIIEAILFDAFDIYRGIETETLELRTLKKIVPIIEPVPRPLPGIENKAWDFFMDEILLRLLNYSPKACRQVNDTIAEWRAERPSQKVKIIADVVDAKVFLEHEVFGEKLRVPLKEAEAIAKAGGHIQWAIILYGDAFVVLRTRALNPRHRH